MRFHPSEPDISTIYNRIKDDDIDLQPDFQRGDVWPLQKRQKLVDTILRGWIVPPILLLSSDGGGRSLVLDGQQRLAAIRDFKEDHFPIDGTIQPRNIGVECFDGCTYSSLPREAQKSFDKHTLRIFEVTDYKPEEPAEIFFRLNQPMPLTSAEKRNAFMGPLRDQIRDLVEVCKAHHPLQSILGFSNSRMAYDDVLARMACTLENGTLWQKITAASVNSMYRREVGLEDQIFRRIRVALDRLSAVATLEEARTQVRGRPKLNKATFLSWLLFFSRTSTFESPEKFAAFFHRFESLRNGPDESTTATFDHEDANAVYWSDALIPVVLVYADRSASRVADVSSVVLRDISLWIGWFEFSEGAAIECMDPAYEKIHDYQRMVYGPPERRRPWTTGFPEFADETLIEFAESISWGRRL